jgi:hypothetical protein
MVSGNRTNSKGHRSSLRRPANFHPLPSVFKAVGMHFIGLRLDEMLFRGTRICRRAIPNRAPLPQGDRRGDGKQLNASSFATATADTMADEEGVGSRCARLAPLSSLSCALRASARRDAISVLTSHLDSAKRIHPLSLGTGISYAVGVSGLAKQNCERAVPSWLAPLRIYGQGPSTRLTPPFTILPNEPTVSWRNF